MHALTRTGQPICAFPCFRYFLHGAEKEDSQNLKAGQLVGCKEEGLSSGSDRSRVWKLFAYFVSQETEPVDIKPSTIRDK